MKSSQINFYLMPDDVIEMEFIVKTLDLKILVQPIPTAEPEFLPSVLDCLKPYKWSIKYLLQDKFIEFVVFYNTNQHIRNLPHFDRFLNITV